jgi:hypothetical protein
MTKNEALDILRAINAMTEINTFDITVNSKEAAETLSELLLLATDNRTGVITGPFIGNIGTFPGSKGNVYSVTK